VEGNHSALNPFASSLDIETMDGSSTTPVRGASFWDVFSAALALLARQSGCSLRESPLPEVREAVRDFAEWSKPPTADVS
jgi:hypothetical protein